MMMTSISWRASQTQIQFADADLQTPHKLSLLIRRHFLFLEKNKITKQIQNYFQQLSTAAQHSKANKQTSKTEICWITTKTEINRQFRAQSRESVNRWKRKRKITLDTKSMAASVAVAAAKRFSAVEALVRLSLAITLLQSVHRKRGKTLMLKKASQQHRWWLKLPLH